MKTSGLLGWWWIGLYACHVYAYSYSGLPNQIFWLYVLLFAAFATAVVLIRSKTALATAVELVSLQLLYIGAFWVVSWWELIPGTSARHLPFHSMDWLLLLAFVAIGYRLTVAQVVDVHQRLAWLVIAYTVGQAWLTPDASRLGLGPLSMFLAVLLVAYRRTVTASCLAMAMLASSHTTPVAAGLAGVIVYTLAFYRGRVLKALLAQRRLIISVTAIGLIAAAVSWDRIQATLARLSEQDPFRAYISENSWRMLSEHGLRGIGYMNFYAWSGIDTGYRGEGRTGAAIEGFNIHNSFMTWALEGGAIVSLVVAVLIWLTIRRARRISTRDARLGALLHGWFAVCFVFALFHQLHTAVQFWATIGLIWGMHARIVRRNLENPGELSAQPSPPDRASTALVA